MRFKISNRNFEETGEKNFGSKSKFRLQAGLPDKFLIATNKRKIELQVRSVHEHNLPAVPFKNQKFDEI